MLMMGPRLVVNNELGNIKQRGFAGAIKAVITDENMVIQGKGTNQLKFRSNHQFIGASNDTDPVQTEKGDRRKFVIS